MNGHILEGTSIAVDYWSKHLEKPYFRFLTHVHDDCISGLTSCFNDYIHTSPFNAWYLKTKLKIDPKFVISLTLEQSYVIFDRSTRMNFSVTLIDANHCPGSVMFLFQGSSFGNILYTGHFCYKSIMLQNQMLRSIVDNQCLDYVYLDNTYAAEHCQFPSQDEALRHIIKLVRSQPWNQIKIGLHKLGKEEVLEAIALELNEMIHVSKPRMDIINQLKLKKVFTTDKRLCRIFAVDMHTINMTKTINSQKAEGAILTLILTALYCSYPFEGFHSVKNYRKFGLFIQPYSDHSSHKELYKFLSFLKPNTIKPIVEEKKESANLFWANTWRNSVMPQSMLNLARKSCLLKDAPVEYSCSPPDGSVIQSKPDKSQSKALHYEVNEKMFTESCFAPYKTEKFSNITLNLFKHQSKEINDNPGLNDANSNSINARSMHNALQEHKNESNKGDSLCEKNNQFKNKDMHNNFITFVSNAEESCLLQQDHSDKYLTTITDDHKALKLKAETLRMSKALQINNSLPTNCNEDCVDSEHRIEVVPKENTHLKGALDNLVCSHGFSDQNDFVYDNNSKTDTNNSINIDKNLTNILKSNYELETTHKSELFKHSENDKIEFEHFLQEISVESLNSYTPDYTPTEHIGDSICNKTIINDSSNHYSLIMSLPEEKKITNNDNDWYENNTKSQGNCNYKKQYLSRKIKTNSSKTINGTLTREDLLNTHVHVMYGKNKKEQENLPLILPDCRQILKPITLKNETGKHIYGDYSLNNKRYNALKLKNIKTVSTSISKEFKQPKCSSFRSNLISPCFKKRKFSHPNAKAKLQFWSHVDCRKLFSSPYFKICNEPPV